jgi:hypothetical protein
VPVTNYYCSLEHQHRLTPCIHGWCRKLGYQKVRVRKGILRAIRRGRETNGA